MVVTSNQISLVLKIIADNPEIKTHKALQKIIYLAQEQSDVRIWRYKWFHFGPFSPSLQAVFTSAVNYKLIKYPIKAGKIQLNQDAEITSFYLNKKLSPFETLLHKSTQEIIKKLGNKVATDPQKLEIIASLHYLFKKEGDLEKAKEKLFLIKNEEMKNEDMKTIEARIKFLTSKK